MKATKNQLVKLTSLVDDMIEIEEWFKMSDASVEGRSLWFCLANPTDFDTDREPSCRCLTPRNNLTREVIYQVLRAHIPAMRDEIMRQIKDEYKQRLGQVKDTF